jgi:hypothetical protein
MPEQNREFAEDRGPPFDDSGVGNVVGDPPDNLLRRFVAHVSEVSRSPFALTVTPSSVGLTSEEVSFLLSLEAEAVRGKEHRERLRRSENR